MKISVVIPTYGAPGGLGELVSRLQATLAPITEGHHEIILVNDACPKGSWAVIRELVSRQPRVKGINLSRNFGQHYAITAGLEASSGDWVVVMDCDLQDVPEEVSNLYNKAMEGHDIVLAARVNRADGGFKRFGSRSFYRVLSYATGTEQNERIANFGIYSRKVVDALLQLKEQLRFLPVNIRWLGFDTVELAVRHASREEGKSSYNLARLLRLATDVIFSFSTKPMGLLIRVGLLISILSVFVAASFVVRYVVNDITVQGWTGIMVSLWFMFGCVLFALGVIGIYVGKAFDEAKGRPIYVVDTVIDSEVAWESHAVGSESTSVTAE